MMNSEFWCGRAAASSNAVVVLSTSGSASTKGAEGGAAIGAGVSGSEEHATPLSSSSLSSSQYWGSYDPGRGCRPCCSNPHGSSGLRSAVASTAAFVLSFSALLSCHYLTPGFEYCIPPDIGRTEKEFGMCGDCHCIPDESASIIDAFTEERACPVESAPNMNFDAAMLQRYQRSECINPIGVRCDPYREGNCTTIPPQDESLLELGEDVECAVKYESFLDGPTYDEGGGGEGTTAAPFAPVGAGGVGDGSSNTNTNTNSISISISISNNVCPAVARYRLITYPGVGLAAEDGAYVTHRGTCGVCSTLQDLAAYIEHTDLVDKGTECSFRGMVNFEDGVRCYTEVGFTEPCARMWMYNGFATRDNCAAICGIFTISGAPNNGPAPECRLNACLNCDELSSGPLFARVAARSRRRSGLLSKIARPCSALLDVRHVDPCDVANGEVNTMRSESTGDGRGIFKKKQERCFNYTDDLGLFYYAGIRSGGGLISRINPFSDIFASEEDQYFRSRYRMCYKYDFKAAAEGLWKDVKKVFGPAFTAASVFSALSVIIVFVSMCTAWVSSCVAYRQVTWTALAVCNLFASIFSFLTLVFMASDVCEFGCKIGAGGIKAIVSGVIFLVAAFSCWTASPYDKKHRSLQCCCCPLSSPDDDYIGGNVTEITVQRTIGRDGTVTTERVTRHPSGFRSMERTIRLADRRPCERKEEGGEKRHSSRQALEGKSSEALEKEPLLIASAEMDPITISDDGKDSNSGNENGVELVRHS